MRSVTMGLAFIALCLVMVAQSNAIIDSATLEAAWLFDDGSGNVARDSSGNGRHGDVRGEAEWTNDGKFGGALMFDGVDDEVAITGYKGIGGTAGRTTVLWYKTTKAGGQRLVCWGADAEAIKYHVRIHDDNTLRIETQGGQLYANTPDLADGVWHHLAVVLPDGSTMCHDHILYVDGVLIEDRGGNDVGLDTDIATNDVEIGYDQLIGHGNYAEGTMDEVAIFNVALSGNNINDIMNQGLSDVLLSVEPGGKLATTWSSLKSSN